MTVWEKFQEHKVLYSLMAIRVVDACYFSNFIDDERNDGDNDSIARNIYVVRIEAKICDAWERVDYPEKSRTTLAEERGLVMTGQLLAVEVI